MSLNTILKQRLVDQFNNAQLVGTSSLSPRVGYYFIKEVNYMELRQRGKFPIATIHWKANEQELFVKDLNFKISLSSLAIGDPLDYLNMVNKTIHIHTVNLINANDNGHPTRLECGYKILDHKPVFTTLQAAILSSFIGNASTLLDAYRNYENNLGIDLFDAFKAEAASDDAFDAPDDDAFDAPTEDK